MPSTTQVRLPAPALIDPSACEPTEPAPPRERNVYDRHSLGALFASQSSSRESADLPLYVSVSEGERPETPFHRPSVPLPNAYSGIPVGIPLPALDTARECWSVTRPETAPAPARPQAREKS